MFPRPGQLQAVCGIDEPRPASPALIYPGVQAGRCTGISFIDSPPLKVCHIRRIYRHKVFKGAGEKQHGMVLRLQIVPSYQGPGRYAFCLSAGNVDGRNMDVISLLCRELSEKLFGDRGYISQGLFEHLYRQGIQLGTRLQKNMKNMLMDMADKILLRKRTVIEPVNDFLKNTCQVERSRHRSVHNFLVNLLAALSAYSFLPHKPSIHGFCDERALLKLFHRTHVKFIAL
jgi:hypothetical protein